MTDAAQLLDEPVALRPFQQGPPHPLGIAGPEAIAGLLSTSTEFNQVRYMGSMSRVSELTVEECQEFHDLMELNEAECALSPPFTVGLRG
jgi:hypothetical protein